MLLDGTSSIWYSPRTVLGSSDENSLGKIDGTAKCKTDGTALVDGNALGSKTSDGFANSLAFPCVAVVLNNTAFDTLEITTHIFFMALRSN